MSYQTNENPRHRWRGFRISGCPDQPADDDEAGAGVAADDEAGAIVLVVTADEAEASADEAADDTDASAEEAADEIADSADDTAELTAADEVTAALEAVVVVLVVLPRLKTQMRPMMMITATMMMIQVLRFMNEPFLLVEVVWEE